MIEQRIRVFVSYAHEDNDLCQRLVRHLKLINAVEVWYDPDIGAGKPWESEIQERLRAAEVIFLLVSVDFMNSEFCKDVEMKQAMERYELGEARVLPVLLRPVDWTDAPFSKLQILPPDGVPVIRWPSGIEDAFVKIAQELRKIVKELRAEQWEREGNKLYADKQYEEARKALEKAIDYNPKLSFAYYILGNILLYHLDHPNHVTEAVASYKKSIELNPDFANAYYDLGNALLYHLGSHEEAKEVYGRAIELGYSKPEVYYELGNALAVSGSYEEAEKKYCKAIDSGFKNGAVYFALGNALCQLHRYNEAAEAYEQAIILEQQNEDYKKAFADALSKATRFPGDKYYPQDVAKAIRECYYGPNSIVDKLGLPRPVDPNDIQKKSPRGTQGYKRHFANGSIYWSERAGSQPIWHFARLYEGRHKGPGGIMGFPLTGELRAAPSPSPWETEGIFQRFEGESEYPEDILMNAVPANLRYGSTAYYSEKHGSYLVGGRIGISYERHMGTCGDLGFPIGNAVNVESQLGTKGLFKAFEGGRIYYSRKTHRAYIVQGTIADLHYALDGSRGRLGFPISDTTQAKESPQGTTGVFQRFEGGQQDGRPVEGGIDHTRGVAVYSSGHGTYPVWGGIGVFYEDIGSTSSALGFPISSEEEIGTTPQGTKKYCQRFEGGSIFYCEDYSKTAIPVVGATFSAYDESGGLNGRFGFPKSLAQPATYDSRLLLQEFEGGVICGPLARAKRWYDADQVVEIMHRIYEQVMERRADESVLVIYGPWLHRGEASIRDIVRILGQSPEYREHFLDEKKLSVDEIVDFACEHFLGRPAQEKDWKHYVQMAEKNASFDPAMFIEYIINGEEYMTQFGEDSIPRRRS